MPLHLSKCSTRNAKKMYDEYTQYFSSYERKHMPPFVVLNIYITLNNLFRHKVPKNKQLLKSRMSDHH